MTVQVSVGGMDEQRKYRQLLITVILLFLPTLATSQTPEETLNKLQQEIADLQMSIPGEPGRDYTILNTVPPTSFVCRDQQFTGYYADVELGCQVFHICQDGGKQDSFLCPNGTVFNQQYFVCDWWFNFNCASAAQFYTLNANLFQEVGSNLHQGLEQIIDPSFLRTSVTTNPRFVNSATPAAEPQQSFAPPLTQSVVLSQINDDVKPPFTQDDTNSIPTKTAAKLRAPPTATRTTSVSRDIARDRISTTTHQSADIGYGLDPGDDDDFAITTHRPPFTSTVTTLATPTTIRPLPTTVPSFPTTVRPSPPTTIWSSTTIRPLSSTPSSTTPRPLSTTTTFRTEATTPTSTSLRPITDEDDDVDAIGYDIDVRANIPEARTAATPSTSTTVGSTSSFATSTTPTTTIKSAKLLIDNIQSPPRPITLSLSRPIAIQGPPVIQTTAIRPPILQQGNIITGEDIATNRPFALNEVLQQPIQPKPPMRFSQPLPAHEDMFPPQQPEQLGLRPELIHTMSFLPENQPIQQEFISNHHQHAPFPPPPPLRQQMLQLQNHASHQLPPSSPLHGEQHFRQQINFQQPPHIQHTQKQPTPQQHLRHPPQPQFQMQDEPFKQQMEQLSHGPFIELNTVQPQFGPPRQQFREQQEFRAPIVTSSLPPPALMHRPISTPFPANIIPTVQQLMEVSLSTKTPLQSPDAIRVVTPPNLVSTDHFRPITNAPPHTQQKSIIKQQKELPPPSPSIRFHSQPQITTTPTPLLDVRQLHTIPPQPPPSPPPPPPPATNFVFAPVPPQPPPVAHLIEQSTPVPPPPHHHDVVRITTQSPKPPHMINEALPFSPPHHMMAHLASPPQQMMAHLASPPQHMMAQLASPPRQQQIQLVELNQPPSFPQQQPPSFPQQQPPSFPQQQPPILVQPPQFHINPHMQPQHFAVQQPQQPPPNVFHQQRPLPLPSPPPPPPPQIQDGPKFHDNFVHQQPPIDFRLQPILQPPQALIPQRQFEQKDFMKSIERPALQTEPQHRPIGHHNVPQQNNQPLPPSFIPPGPPMVDSRPPPQHIIHQQPPPLQAVHQQPPPQTQFIQQKQQPSKILPNIPQRNQLPEPPPIQNQQPFPSSTPPSPPKEFQKPIDSPPHHIETPLFKEHLRNLPNFPTTTPSELNPMEFIKNNQFQQLTPTPTRNFQEDAIPAERPPLVPPQTQPNHQPNIPFASQPPKEFFKPMDQLQPIQQLPLLPPIFFTQSKPNAEFTKPQDQPHSPREFNHKSIDRPQQQSHHIEQFQHQQKSIDSPQQQSHHTEQFQHQQKSIDRPQQPSHHTEQFQQQHKSIDRPQQPSHHNEQFQHQQKSIDRPQQQSHHNEQFQQQHKSIDRPQQQSHHNEQFQHQQKSIDSPQQPNHHNEQFQQQNHHDEQLQHQQKSIDRPQQQSHHNEQFQHQQKSIDRPQQQPQPPTNSDAKLNFQQHRPEPQKEFIKSIDKPQDNFQSNHQLNKQQDQQHHNNIMNQLPPIFIPRTKQKPALPPENHQQQFSKHNNQENRQQPNNFHQNQNFVNHQNTAGNFDQQNHRRPAPFFDPDDDDNDDHHPDVDDNNDFFPGGPPIHDNQFTHQGRFMSSYASSSGPISDYSSYLPMQRAVTILRYK
ncbi:hypothetical protein CHUAL_007640 [Chamberlinius hualienensis]